MTLSAGDRLGPYEILSPLGAGGMGEVYRARDAKLERDVAVKVLPERLASDADSLSRFDREARAVAALSHPNILSTGRRCGSAWRRARSPRARLSSMRRRSPAASRRRTRRGSCTGT
jgi:Protein kinase domain